MSSTSIFDSIPETEFETECRLEELTLAVREKRYSEAYTLLNEIKQGNLALDDPDWKISQVLFEGLRCPIELFRALYERLVGDGPVTGSQNINIYRMRFGYVKGSLLTLAAAFDLPEHTQYLIEKGNKVGGPKSAALCDQTVELQPQDRKPEDLPGELELGGFSLPIHGYGNVISECTPLGAAIACGSVSALGVLLKQIGERWTEDPSACRAMALAPSENRQWNAMHELCVNAVLRASDDPSVRSGLGGVKLPLRGIADICTPELFAQQILTFRPDAEEVYIAVIRLIRPQFLLPLVHLVQEACAPMEKLKLLASEFPELCREKRVAGAFLAGLCSMNTEDEALWDCCMELWDGTVDLTWAADEIFALSQKALRSLLLRLRGKHVVINADAFSRERTTPAALKMLLRCVEVEPSCFRKGLSGLAHCLLHREDPKLWRDVDAVRYLRREPRNTLKNELENVRNTAVRSMLLLACGTHKAAALNRARLKDYKYKGEWESVEQKLKRWHTERADTDFWLTP